jgi:CheY-like chemotaxis protein
MAPLLSFTDTTRCDTPLPPQPVFAPKSITASSQSALLVENDSSLLHCLRRSLTAEGYAVRTAATGEEGLRLYRDCAPFNVVLIDYCVPHTGGCLLNSCGPQTDGISLALAIRHLNPTQGIILAAFDYRSPDEVPRPPEIMHLPLLIDISKFQLRAFLEKIEIERRIELLTPPELLKLRRAAGFFINGLGRSARLRTGDDLLGEALLRTLIGADPHGRGRRWNKDVDFVRHLVGAMQSIANSWKRQAKDKETHLISELVFHDAEGQEYSPLDHLSSPHPAADQNLIEKTESSASSRYSTMTRKPPASSMACSTASRKMKCSCLTEWTNVITSPQ